MLPNWQVFEDNCVKFLEDNTKSNNIKYIQTGKSNSRESDIKVYKNSKFLFSIESKYIPAQCGQFVLEKNDFLELSKQNFTINKYSQPIVDTINDLDLDLELNLNRIDIDNELMFDWIKEHYSNKNVKYFISSNQIDKNFNLIELEEIDKFFDVYCVLRKKKSGSRDVSNKKREEMVQVLKHHLKKQNIEVLNITLSGKSTLIKTSKTINSKYFMNKMGYLSEVENNLYKLKTLSNTNNLTFIFSINYKENTLINSLKYFKESLV